MTIKKVAIIGAGAAGLLSAKHALENNLLPFVFEKSNSIGGLWSLDSSFIWKGLITNTSVYREMFMNYSWPDIDNTPMFPSAMEINAYLVGFCKQFCLNDYIFLNNRIDQVKLTPCGKWKVNSINVVTNEEKSELFEYLIVASGEHAIPKIPYVENSKHFKGLQLHSSQFQLDDSRLKSKKVIVVRKTFAYWKVLF